MKKIFTSSPLSLDFGLLLLRVLLAAGLLTHGIAKIANFSALSTSFLDPLGIGVLPALLGAIFAEVVCSILVLIGLWTRLTVLPLIFTFIVVFFVVAAVLRLRSVNWRTFILPAGLFFSSPVQGASRLMHCAARSRRRQPKAASLRRRICRQMILRFKSLCAGESLPTLFLSNNRWLLTRVSFLSKHCLPLCR